MTRNNQKIKWKLLVGKFWEADFEFQFNQVVGYLFLKKINQVLRYQEQKFNKIRFCSSREVPGLKCVEQSQLLIS